MTKIEVKHLYSQGAEALFDAFLNVDIAQNFMFKTDNGKVVKAEVDPELGGNFVFIEQRGETRVEHNGTFVEIEKPTKLSFIFSVNQSNDTDYIEIFFNKNSSGCEIILKQEVKPEFSEYIEKIKMGWTTILNKLDQVVSNQNQESVTLITKDSLGQALSEGDSVKTIKDLKVKGSSMVVKRGTVVKKIHLISGNDEEVDCRVDGVALSLETQWLVKV